MTPRTSLTELLQETGWSLREWERRSGLSINTLRAISAGKSGTPQKRTLHALSTALREASGRFEELAAQVEAIR